MRREEKRREKKRKKKRRREEKGRKEQKGKWKKFTGYSDKDEILKVVPLGDWKAIHLKRKRSVKKEEKKKRKEKRIKEKYKIERKEYNMILYNMKNKKRKWRELNIVI